MSMNIVIPMAGAGSRFLNAGIATHKPLIPTTARLLKKKVPMVLAAAMDAPFQEGDQFIYVLRDFDAPLLLASPYCTLPNLSTFITVDHLSEGQACSVLQACDLIDNDQELFIAACDNGMDYDLDAFLKLKQTADCIVFAHQSYAHMLRPEAYSWIKLGEDQSVSNISLKKTVSDFPAEDCALVGAFWFKQGREFVAAAQNMIQKQDHFHSEYYVDQVINYIIAKKLSVKVFVIDQYLCWGTPEDHHLYEQTYEYWSAFKKALVDNP